MAIQRHTSIARAVERWFALHQRPFPWRRTYAPYEVWISEVMAQQTRIEVVVGYFEKFLLRFPDVASLAGATADEVTAEWSGLGYYRRARMLREGAVAVIERFGGKLPESVEELLTIPGIGRYTAGAISSIAYRHRAPIVDGNVARILARLEGDEDPWRHATSLVAACRKPRDFNQGLMEIGALVCRPRNPLCMECPVRSECVAFATDRIHELPSKTEKAATRTLRLDIYLVTDDRGRILLRRETGPLMTGLFHLPHGDTTLLSAPPLTFREAKPIGSFRHTVTSRRIEFTLFSAATETAGEGAGQPAVARGAGESIADSDAELVWVAPADLRHIPHPSYVAKALRLARNHGHPGGVAAVQPQ